MSMEFPVNIFVYEFVKRKINLFSLYQSVGRWVMVIRVIPAFIIASYIELSTSIDTALVHSSKRAYRGLKVKKNIFLKVWYVGSIEIE